MPSAQSSSHPYPPHHHPLDELHDLVFKQSLVPLIDVLALGRYYRAFLLLYFRLRKQGLISERESSRLFLIGFHHGFQAHLAEYLDITDPYNVPFSVEVIFETAVDLFKHRKSFTSSIQTHNSLIVNLPVDLISFEKLSRHVHHTLFNSVSILSSPQDAYDDDIPYLPFESLLPTLIPSSPPATPPPLDNSLSSAHSHATSDSVSVNSSLPITVPLLSPSPLSCAQVTESPALTTLIESSCRSFIPVPEDHITNSSTSDSVTSPIPSQQSSSTPPIASPIISPAPFLPDLECHSEFDSSNAVHPAPGFNHQASSSFSIPPPLSSIHSVSEDHPVDFQPLLLHSPQKNYDETNLLCISSSMCPSIEPESRSNPCTEFEDLPIPLTTHPPSLSFHELHLPCIPNCQPTLSVLDTTINHPPSASIIPPIPSISSISCVSRKLTECWVLVSY